LWLPARCTAFGLLCACVPGRSRFTRLPHAGRLVTRRWFASSPCHCTFAWFTLTPHAAVAACVFGCHARTVAVLRLYLHCHHTYRADCRGSACLVAGAFTRIGYTTRLQRVTDIPLRLVCRAFVAFRVYRVACYRAVQFAYLPSFHAALSCTFAAPRGPLCAAHLSHVLRLDRVDAHPTRRGLPFPTPRGSFTRRAFGFLPPDRTLRSLFLRCLYRLDPARLPFIYVCSWFGWSLHCPALRTTRLRICCRCAVTDSTCHAAHGWIYHACWYTHVHMRFGPGIGFVCRCLLPIRLPPHRLPLRCRFGLHTCVPFVHCRSAFADLPFVLVRCCLWIAAPPPHVGTFCGYHFLPVTVLPFVLGCRYICIWYVYAYHVILHYLRTLYIADYVVAIVCYHCVALRLPHVPITRSRCVDLVRFYVIPLVRLPRYARCTFALLPIACRTAFCAVTFGLPRTPLPRRSPLHVCCYAHRYAFQPHMRYLPFWIVPFCITDSAARTGCCVDFRLPPGFIPFWICRAFTPSTRRSLFHCVLVSVAVIFSLPFFCTHRHVRYTAVAYADFAFCHTCV